MKPYIALGVVSLGLYFAYQLVLVDGSPRERPAAVAQGTQFAWEGRVGEGQAVEVRGLNGGIRVGPASGQQVVVRATKRARRSDPSTVRVEVTEHGDGITVCAVYPGGDERCGEGHEAGRVNDVTVQFRVEIPDGVRFVGRTVNGSVRAEGLTDDVEVHSVNGSVTIDTRGSARARTVNGTIRAAVGSVDGFDDLEFTTTNGTITLALPRDVQAVLEGRTGHGSISSDFPLEISGNRTMKQFTGVLGSGGENIRLESVNGSIRIVERR